MKKDKKKFRKLDWVKGLERITGIELFFNPYYPYFEKLIKEYRDNENRIKTIQKKIDSGGFILHTKNDKGKYEVNNELLNEKKEKVIQLHNRQAFVKKELVKATKIVILQKIKRNLNWLFKPLKPNFKNFENETFIAVFCNKERRIVKISNCENCSYLIEIAHCKDCSMLKVKCKIPNKRK